MTSRAASSEAEPSTESTKTALVSVAALLMSVAFLLMGHGLQQTLLPIRGGMEDFSGIEVGLLGSSYFAGFVLGCLCTPFVIIRAGHVRTFAALVAVASSAALAHAMLVDPFVWMLCRAITGACLAGLYLVIESWLNERSTNRTRGTIMAAYVTINLTVITIGQMLVPLFDPLSFVQLSVASILMSLAAVPVALTKAQQPAPVTIVRFRPVMLYHLSPAGVIGVLMVGFANGAFWSLGPAYGQDIGLSVALTALFMSLVVIGGAAAQYPLGLLSDRVDRRFVMIGLSVACIGFGLLLTGQLELGESAILAVSFLFGAALLPGYTIASAHVFDHAPHGAYVEVSAGLLLMLGVGSVIGPIFASSAMQFIGPGALFGYIALVHCLLILYVVFRVFLRRAPSREEKEHFNLATAGPVVVIADAEAVEASDLVVTTAEPTPGSADSPTDEAPRGTAP